MITTPTATHDRVKLPFIFNAAKLQNEVRQLKLHQFIYYNALPIRSPAHLVDTSLPVPPPAEDYADGSWTEWMDTPEMAKCPYLSEVVNTFKQHTKVTLVRLLRLEAGAEVKKHTDPTLGIEVEKSVVRMTIPIFSSEQVEFYLNDTVVPMKEGECWYLRLTDPHYIFNKGTTERINLTIDMIPNEWVRQLILRGQ